MSGRFPQGGGFGAGGGFGLPGSGGLRPPASPGMAPPGSPPMGSVGFPGQSSFGAGGTPGSPPLGPATGTFAGPGGMGFGSAAGSFGPGAPGPATGSFVAGPSAQGMGPAGMYGPGGQGMGPASMYGGGPSSPGMGPAGMHTGSGNLGPGSPGAMFGGAGGMGPSSPGSMFGGPGNFGGPGGPLRQSMHGGLCPACGENTTGLKNDLQSWMSRCEQQEHQMRMMNEQLIRTQEEVQTVGHGKTREREDFDTRLRKSDEARVDAENKLRVIKQEKQDLSERVSYLEKKISSEVQVDTKALSEQRGYLRKIEELQEQTGQFNQQQLAARSEIQRLNDIVTALEAQNARLTEQVVELQDDVNAVESEAVRLEAMNKALQQVVDEKEVQVAAMQLYEAEFDRTFSARLDEREKALAEANREKDTLAVKVKELQDELGLSRKIGGQGDVQELTSLLKEKQLDIYDLEDRNEELEEELGRVRQALEQAKSSAPVALPVGGSAVPVTIDSQKDVGEVSDLQQRLANFKTDALHKDQKIQDLEKKLDEFAAGLGAQGLLMQNRQYERQVMEMKQQVANSKHDLSQYLSDAASIVYENELLRQYAKVSPEQFDLQEFKLKEKVLSAKAVAATKQLEREVAELEDERMRLKARLRRMSELAAEKVSLLHDLQPEQMLHLEEIAASMRRGKYEAPLTDESRQLKKEKDELQKKLKEKDQQLADHVGSRIDELLKKTGATKELETKLAALQQENLGLKAMNDAMQRGTQQAALEAAQQAMQMGGVGMSPEIEQMLQQQLALLEQQAQGLQQQQQPQTLQVPKFDQAVGPSMPPTPAVIGGVPASPSGRRFGGGQMVPMSPSASSIMNISGLGGSMMPGLAQRIQKQKAQMAMSSGFGMGPLGASMMGGAGMGACAMPQMPGMPPMAWSPHMQAAVQLPRELSDGSQATTCALYCQVVETVEELEKERTLRKSLAEDVEVFSQKYDRLVAEQEVLYRDYFRQRANWEAEKKGYEERLKLQNDMNADTRSKLDNQERQNTELRNMVKQSAPGQPDGEYKSKLVDAMTRIAALELNESVLSRKCDAAQEEHRTVRQAFDNLEKDIADRDKFLKERLSKALLWKKSASHALRIARKRLSQMVPAPNFERVQQELAVSKRRELDLARRQSDLALANAAKEDRLREMSDVQERCSNLDVILRETEQEYTVMRRRLQRHDPRFATECSLFTRLACEVQRALGLVGLWDPVQRTLLAAEPGVQLTDGDYVQLQSIDAMFDDRLRRLDTNNDGFVTLGDVVSNFQNLGLKVSDAEVLVLAEAFHVSTPVQATVVQPPPGATVAGEQASPLPSTAASLDIPTLKKASVSVLAVVGRLRLFGMRRLEPEDLFWSAVQALMMGRQLHSTGMLKSNFQVHRSPDGYITVRDVLRVLANIEVAADRLPTRGLRRVLAWLGVEPRVLDQEAPLETLPKHGDPMDEQVRQKLAQIKLIYHDFEVKYEKNCARALQILCPPEAYPSTPGPSTTSSVDVKASSASVDIKVNKELSAHTTFMAEAREAAANRRCVVLEQEVRTKIRTIKELQRQVSELEQLSQRLEVELHEERGRGVEVKSRLDNTFLSLNIKKTEELAAVEQKLKKLEEVSFQAQQLQIVLQQEKDMRRVCATQADNYEKLVKRRQQEVRHLQDTVKMLQCKDEVSNTVGKIQYRLLLSMWEKSNMQRQLDGATQELKRVRTQFTEFEGETEKEKRVWEEESEDLQHRLSDAEKMTETYKEQATGSLPIDKARELTSKVDQIAASKSAVEEKLSSARKELHRNETERQELKLQAEQAKLLAEELSAFEENSEAPRTRLLEMAKKLESSKLLELKHRRDLEISKEECSQAIQGRKADEKAIAKLQEEVAQAEKKLVSVEEQWREKILQVQQTVMTSGAIPPGTAANAPGPGRLGSKSTLFDRFRIGQQVEELSKNLNDKDAKINDLQAKLEKADAEKNQRIADEQIRIRKLEQELNLVTTGDAGRVRQVLRAEHEEEMKQVSAAAHESVSTLQMLIDEAEARISERDTKINELIAAKHAAARDHVQEIKVLQDQIASMRNSYIERPGAVMTPAHAHAVDLKESLEQSMASLDDMPHLGLDAHFEERRKELHDMHQRLTDHEAGWQEKEGRWQDNMKEWQQKEVKWQEMWRNQQQEYSQHLAQVKQGMVEEFRAREKKMYDAVRAREQELQQREMEVRQRCEYLQEQLQLVHSQGQQGIHSAHDEARKHQMQAHAHHQQLQANAQAHALSLEEQKLATDVAQAEIRKLRAELEEEKVKNKKSSMRTQQDRLREQMHKKQEQLDRQRQEVQELKNQFVQLSMEKDREKNECQQARVAEAEMRGRVGQLEERARGMNEHVKRLTEQLQDVKQQHSHEVARIADRYSREAELDKLLEEASARLQERSAEARKSADASHQHQAMRESAEQMLKTERNVLQGEVQKAQEEARFAEEASRKRVTTLHERIDAVLAERDSLWEKLQTLEGADAALRGITPQEAAELQDKLRSEQQRNDKLKGQVYDLTSQLELAQLRRGMNATGPAPGRNSPLRFDHTAPLPSSPQPDHLVGSPIQRSRSVSPITQIQPNHLIQQAAELTAKCNQLEIESAAARAKVTRLEQENDDLKLKMMTDHDGGELNQLRLTAESFGAHSRNLAAELDAERTRSRMLEDQNRKFSLKMQQLQQHLSDVTQQLDIERDRVRSSSQAFGANIGGAMGAMSNSIDASAMARIQNENQSLRHTVSQMQNQMSTSIDASALAKVQNENQSLRNTVSQLQNQLQGQLEENVQLRREVSAATAGSGGYPMSGGLNPQVNLLKSQLADAQSKLEELLHDNNQLRRSRTPERSVQADTAMNARLRDMQMQMEQDASAIGKFRIENQSLRNQLSQLQDQLQVQVHLGGMPTNFDASALAQVQNENQNLRNQLQAQLEENVQLRREASATAPGSSGYPTPGSINPQVSQLKAQLAEAQSKLEQLLNENTKLLRRSQSPERPLPSQADTAMTARLQNMKVQMEQVMTENVQLRRSASPDPMPNSELAQRFEALHAKNAELLRENVQLRRTAGLSPDAPVWREELDEAQARTELQQTRQENAQLRRDLNALDQANMARITSGVESAELSAARKQIIDLKSRVAETTAERDDLQQKVREATAREFALIRKGRSGVSGELRTADEDRDRDYLLTKVDSLQNENDELRRWSERQQSRNAEEQGDSTTQFQRDHAALMEKSARLGAQNMALQREIAELHRERALRPDSFEDEAAKLSAQNKALQKEVAELQREKSLRSENIDEELKKAVVYADDVKKLSTRNDELEREISNLKNMLLERDIPQPARSAAESLRSALQRRGLSLIAMLTELDPMQQHQVSFESFRHAVSRHRLELTAADLDLLKAALHPNAQGRFSTQDLLNLVRVAEDAEKDYAQDQGRGHLRGEALEGLPPPPGHPVASRRRIRSTSSGGVRSAQPKQNEHDIGNAEARHRRQMEALNTSLRQADEDRARLQRELNQMKAKEADTNRKAAAQQSLRESMDPGPTSAQPLKVLLAAGESAATIKDLRLEVQGTRELRDKLFAVETEFEECRRRLFVDARADLEREQQKNVMLQRELEDRERTIAHLGFDLKRARAAAGSGDAEEEYHMTLSLQSRRLEEELINKRKSEADLMEKVLELEHQVMELKFEREQARSRASRLENRLLELELLSTDQVEHGGATPNSRAAPAPRQVRNLEQVIEGLERVIAQQKVEQKRLRDELDGKKDDRRHKAEVARLRKKIEGLEEELGARDQQQRRSPKHRTAVDLSRAREAHVEAQEELQQKEAKIAGLEQQIRDLVAARVVSSDAAAATGGSPGDVARLEAELRELRLAREADSVALDEAQRALHEAELTEKRYVEVARENKKLRAEIGALEDEGFWQEIEALQARNDDGIKLLRESREAMCNLFGAFPSLEPPSGLLARIERHVASAAVAA